MKDRVAHGTLRSSTIYLSRRHVIDRRDSSCPRHYTWRCRAPPRRCSSNLSGGLHLPLQCIVVRWKPLVKRFLLRITGRQNRRQIDDAIAERRVRILSKSGVSRCRTRCSGQSSREH